MEITRSAHVMTRHSKTCPDRDKGPSWPRCNCRKALLIYDGIKRNSKGVLTNTVRSAGTRSWQKAELKAKEWLDQFDPTQQELKRLRVQREAESTTIEKAVNSYVKDMVFRLGDNGTVARARTLLGNVDDSGTVKRKGKLFEWLDKQLPRPVYISEITPKHLDTWRNTWKFPSDLTTASSWTTVKTFLKYCKSMGWINANPAAEMRRPQTKKGNRTATFTDEEYARILDAAHGNQRLETMLELLRWSGMALIDAVEFHTKLLDDKGVLRYKRKKTGTIATVKLPDHVLAFLRSVPLEKYNTPDQPFLRPSVEIDSCIQDWRVALQELFALAGCSTVKTDVRERPSHPHMLRDTCAVWYLRHGMSLYGVAKILGHSNPTITARAYLPFVKELEKAHIAENEEVLVAARPKTSSRVLRINRK